MKKTDIPFQASIDLPPVTFPTPKQQTYTHAKSISILIGGAAGTGIKTLETLLTDALRSCGYFVFSTIEYMSRVRGGSNSTLLRISDAPINAPCWMVDLFVALDADAIAHVRERLSAQTIVLADDSVSDAQIAITSLPMLTTAKELSNVRYANAYVPGVLFGLFGLSAEMLSESIETLFDGEHLVGNESAMREGFIYSQSLKDLPLPKLPEPTKGLTDSMHLMDGSTASGFGFLAGGCNMITSYPMSPSTAVLNFMASMSQHFTVLVEQSEDEIASLNMVLGGWYSGARAMTSTSGGGFALMCEAMSLSGVSETPAVIYLAQRPGPATGMPTRTEQSDLNLAIHSGHGDFGHIVLAPGDLRECIDYGYLAFEVADRYQMPVVYLSDQYLADSMSMIESVDFDKYEQRRYIQPTDTTYDRYTLSATGITPRGIPSLGEGLVVSSSNEHDERGQSTESYHVREQMVEKRQKKVGLCISEAFKPAVLGEGSIAVIGWGSTKAAITEVLKKLGDPRLFQVHFTWVHPLNPEHLEFLKQTETNVIIENNVTGQFADILKSHDVEIHHRILQSNGFSFFVDQLKEKLRHTLKEIK